MFIDFLTLVMINLVAGTVLLAYYLWKGLDAEDQKPYAAAFGLTGLLSMILGLRISFTWPLPGSYNIGFGETTTLFGVVFLATAISLAKGWDLKPVALYAFFAGVYAVIVGIRIWSLQLGKEPLIASVGLCPGGSGRCVRFSILPMVPRKQGLPLDCPLDCYPDSFDHGSHLGSHILRGSLEPYGQLRRVGSCHDGTIRGIAQ